MLTRPADPRLEARRAARREQMRRYRKRLRDGRVVCQVEVDAAILAWLTKLQWLAPRDDREQPHTRQEIGKALEEMLEDASGE
jgi:hypothetical protein